MFDRRKDQTLCSTNMNENTLRGSIKEEHISIISEPGSVYQDHITPNSGKASDIDTELVLSKKEIFRRKSHCHRSRWNG